MCQDVPFRGLWSMSPMVEKFCKCGQKKKSIACTQDFLCESKCQRMRQCGRHICRRKVQQTNENQFNYSIVWYSAAMGSVLPVTAPVADLSYVKLTSVQPLVTLVSCLWHMLYNCGHGARVSTVVVEGEPRSVLSILNAH